MEGRGVKFKQRVRFLDDGIVEGKGGGSLNNELDFR